MIAQAGRRVQQPRSLPLGAEKLFKLDLNNRQKDHRCGAYGHLVADPIGHQKLGSDR